MRILVVEDEPIIAERVQRQVKAILVDESPLLKWCDGLDDALDYLASHEIDLLLLDLNLHGADGFEVIKSVAASSFHTIIISAYAEQAIRAFEFGVLDFVAKPFTQSRLEKALQRFLGHKESSRQLRTLAIKKAHGVEAVPVESVIYIQADGHYSSLMLLNGKAELHSKSIDKLQHLLPIEFIRVHRSYLVNSRYVKKLHVGGGGQYHLQLEHQLEVPLSRSRYREIKALLFT